MIKRAMKTNFGGAWVFPGGKVDRIDEIQNIDKYSPSLNDEEASRRLGTKSGGLIYWIACIRECFEESGILLADNEQRKINLGSLTDSELEIINQYKKKLLEGKDVFLELIDKFELTLSTSEIAYIFNIITAIYFSSRKYPCSPKVCFHSTFDHKNFYFRIMISYQ